MPKNSVYWVAFGVTLWLLWRQKQAVADRQVPQGLPAAAYGLWNPFATNNFKPTSR
jgi:hypothetical protein